jgi:hypothetical protein
VFVVDTSRERLACIVVENPEPQPRPDDEKEPGALPPAPPVQPTEGIPPPPPGFLGRWAVLYGVAAGTVVYALAYGASLVNGTDTAGYWVFAWLGYGALATVVMLIAGNVLAIIRKTRGFGMGLLISIGVGIIAGSGVCIALLSSA